MLTKSSINLKINVLFKIMITLRKLTKINYEVHFSFNPILKKGEIKKSIKKIKDKNLKKYHDRWVNTSSS